MLLYVYTLTIKVFPHVKYRPQSSKKQPSDMEEAAKICADIYLPLVAVIKTPVMGGPVSTANPTIVYQMHSLVVIQAGTEEKERDGNLLTKIMPILTPTFFRSVEDKALGATGNMPWTAFPAIPYTTVQA